MKTIYLNMNGNYGIETVDEFTQEQGQSEKDFRMYVNEMARETRLAGMPVYQSQRACKDWK